MAFSVDAWGQAPVMPQFPVSTLSSVQPPVAKLQLTPVQDIEPTLVVKWLPVIVPVTRYP